MKIIENALNVEQAELIKKNLLGANFPWFFQRGVNLQKDGYSQFTHIFYETALLNNSNYFNLIVPILNILKPKAFLKIKSNLLLKTDKIIEHGYHNDMIPIEDYKSKTAIYYVNTNNGYTRFTDKKIIKCEFNKLIYFDNKIKHSGSTCTDELAKVVINFNYY